jgi:hypothetical protein
MAGYQQSFPILETPDLDDAFRKFLAQTSDAWWRTEPATVAAKHDRYRVVSIPEGAPRHLSVAQVEQGVMWTIVPATDRFGPWLAYPIGGTAESPSVDRWTTPTYEADQLRGGSSDGLLLSGNPAPHHVQQVITHAWGQITGPETMTAARVVVEFSVVEHSPVGEHSGWVFYGWVNG